MLNGVQRMERSEEKKMKKKKTVSVIKILLVEQSYRKKLFDTCLGIMWQGFFSFLCAMLYVQSRVEMNWRML